MNDKDKNLNVSSDKEKILANNEEMAKVTGGGFPFFFDSQVMDISLPYHDDPDREKRDQTKRPPI